MTSNRMRSLALQGLASAITALLLGGAALAFGAPSEEPRTPTGAAATEAATHPPTDAPTEPAEEPTQSAPAPTEDALAEDEPERGDAAGRALGRVPKEQRDDGDRGRGDEASAQRGGNGQGKAHGKAVSDAARGVSEPVGDCENHGHWVSTVARGGSSCDEFPRSGGDD